MNENKNTHKVGLIGTGMVGASFAYALMQRGTANDLVLIDADAAHTEGEMMDLNRAGVERVMGFCNEDEYQEFLRACPEFEKMLIRSGTILIKYWFLVSDEEQERRFQARIDDPTKRWKLSPMDLESRSKWVEYSRAKDTMFAYTDTRQSPWHVVNADDKKRARLNVIAHLLSKIPYQDLTPQQIKLPPRQDDKGYVRPPLTDQTFVPELY